jgi:hypothetical protein
MPCIPQVFKVYLVMPIIWLYNDLRSRSLVKNIRVYLVGMY